MNVRTAELLDSVRAHHPADARERGHHTSFLLLLTTAADPFSRGGYNPGHVTAGVFIVDGEGRLLLHHHRRLDRWLQMGGHIEEGESAREAALREGREESGLTDLELVGDTPLDLDVHAIPAGRGEPAHHHFDVRFLARTQSPQSIKLDETESRELAWVNFDRAETMMNEEASSRVLRKLRAALGGRLL